MYSWHLHIVLQNFLMSLLQANLETIKLYITIEFNKKKKKKKKSDRCVLPPVEKNSVSTSTAI